MFDRVLHIPGFHILPAISIYIHSYCVLPQQFEGHPLTGLEIFFQTINKDFNDSFSQYIALSTQYASLIHLTSVILYFAFDVWDKVFKSGLSKFCGRQPLKNFKGYGLLKQTISLQIF